MEETKRRRRAQKRKKRGAWPILLFLLLVLAALLAMSPVCNVTEIEVTGNARVATETIKEAAGNPVGRNIFRLSTGHIEKKVGAVPYVKSVTVRRHLPGKLRITVEESDLCLFVPCKGQMLAISRDARVADVISTDNAVGAPVAVGIGAADYEVGQPLKTDQKEELELALRFTDLLKEYGLFQKVTEITPDTTNLTFVVGYRLTVEFGTEDEANYKMKYLKQVMSEVGETTDGVINIRSVDHVTFREGHEEESKENTTASAVPEAAGETEEAATEEPTMVPEPE